MLNKYFLVCFVIIIVKNAETTRLKLINDVARLKRSSEEKTSSISGSSFKEGIPKQVALNVMALRPAVRHHIAHFCPNLDIARKCIRTCMIQNKPAFCGKDHVCYCGHRYGSPSDDMEHSTQGYGQFYDLYEKYFGPRQNQQFTITDSSEKGKSNQANSDTVDKLDFQPTRKPLCVIICNSSNGHKLDVSDDSTNS